MTSLEKISKNSSKWEFVSVKNSLDKFPVYSNSFLYFPFLDIFLIFGDRDNKGERNNDIISFNPANNEITQSPFKLGNSNWFYRNIYFIDFEGAHNFLSRNGHLHRFDPKGSSTWEYIREYVSVK